jgi:hypothetical protein
MYLRPALAFAFDLGGWKCLVVSLSQDGCRVCGIGRNVAQDVIGAALVTKRSRRRALA